MTRIARVVVPEAPHHVTQRGNRGERIFEREVRHEEFGGITELRPLSETNNLRDSFLVASFQTV